MRLRFTVLCMLLTTLLITVCSPLYIFLIVINYLCIEYVILLGGFMLWLNDKTKEAFEETSVLCNLISVDGKFIIGTCAVFTLYSLVYCDLGFPLKFPIFNSCAGNTQALITHLIARLAVITATITTIHSMLISERLIGLAVAYHPPLCSFIRKLTRKAKLGDRSNENSHCR